MQENTAGHIACQRERILRVPGREHLLSQVDRPSEAPAELRKPILDLADSWAHESGFLPCREYQMAAALLHDSPGYTYVSIGPESCEALDLGWVPPSAFLVVSHEPLEIVEAQIGHSGCAYRRNLPEAN
ncbi:MAG: hypothetical protein AAF430_18515 [Myxococcota bacterium]